MEDFHSFTNPCEQGSIALRKIVTIYGNKHDFVGKTFSIINTSAAWRAHETKEAYLRPWLLTTDRATSMIKNYENSAVKWNRITNIFNFSPLRDTLFSKYGKFVGVCAVLSN